MDDIAETQSMTNTKAAVLGESLDSLHRTELSLPKYRVEESDLSCLLGILTARWKDIFSLIYLKFVFMGQEANLE